MRLRDHALEVSYANKLRKELPSIETAILDDYRRTAEEYGERFILGDLAGDELARLCDEELAARCVAEDRS